MFILFLGRLQRVFVGVQVILTRFPSLRDVALARQVTELTNQRVRFDVNPEPLNL